MARTTSIFLLLILTLSGHARVSEAKHAYTKQQFDKAELLFRDAANKASGSKRYRLRFAEAAAAYRQNKFSEAAKAYAESLRSNDPTFQEKAHYNLANTITQEGEHALKNINSPEERSSLIPTVLSKWEDAVAQYEDALHLNSKNKQARENLDLLKKRIEELKKEQEQEEEEEEEEQQQQQDQDQENDSQEQEEQQEKEQENSNDRAASGEDRNSSKETSDQQSDQENEEGNEQGDESDAEGEEESPEQQQGEQGEQEEGEQEQGEGDQPSDQTSDQQNQANQESPEGQQSDQEDSSPSPTPQNPQPSQTMPLSERRENETPEEHARRQMSEYADFGESLPKRQDFRPSRTHKDW